MSAGERALLVVCVALALAGCFDPLRGVAPFVLVRSTFDIEGAGQVDGFRAVPCFGATYETDPPRVVARRPHSPEASRMRVDFVIVFDMGDSWRPWVANASSLPSALALISGSGGGMFSVLEGNRGSSGFGMDPPFPRSEAYSLEVRWQDAKAWLDGQELVRGESLTQTHRYHVATANASLDVREDIVATYVGKAHVELVPPDPACERPPGK